MTNNDNPVSTTQPICADVLLEKYCKEGETTEDQIFRRVAKGIASVESEKLVTREFELDGVLVKKPISQRSYWEQVFYNNMKNGGLGAGRIMSSGGTGIGATLINCFVTPVGDCMEGYDEDGNPGIYTALSHSAFTLRRGGGVGYNFSNLRPNGAIVKGVGGAASGPCSYMNIFDSNCGTIESAGQRRGAQMGVLNIDHPDVLDFVKAKRTPGRWNNFNVSVFVTNAFMKAKNNDEDWQLVHKAEPSKTMKEKGVFKREDGLWVYKTIKAKELWDTIMQSNYDYAEPGILFKDTINNDNNLRYIEKIEATNP